MSAPTEDEIKTFLQRHLQRGIVTVVGSGLSCAEGLPGMSELADRISIADPVAAGVTIKPGEWLKVTETIRLNGLETALQRLTIDDDVADFIREQTASFLFEREEIAVREVFAGRRQLQFSKLLAHLPQDGRLPIITTNYDRLIELSAELAGFKVDTKAFGLYHAPFSKAASAYAYCERIDLIKKTVRPIEQRVISLYKPHGSLDWVSVNGTAIRTGFRPGSSHCLIITPGQNKYRAGYDQPFDMQRELANRAIDEAQRFLVIGYGFNDDHLETHLSSRIKSGAPTVIMTFALTTGARQLLLDNPSLMALEAKPSDPTSTMVHFQGSTIELPKQAIWNPEGFVREVMNS